MFKNLQMQNKELQAETKADIEQMHIVARPAQMPQNPLLGAVCPMLKLKCQTCDAHYEKPQEYEKWNNEHKNIFFRWSLIYCDKCRREKEIQALKNLPKVMEALSELKGCP